MNRENAMNPSDNDHVYYTARYEELLLQQRILRQGLHKQDACNGVAALVVNHAEMITMLESAMKSVKTRNYWENTTSNKEQQQQQQHLEQALHTLLDETWNRHMYENDQEDTSIHDTSSYKSLSSWITMSALQQCDDDDESQRVEPGGASKMSFRQEDVPTDSKSMVNAFFNDYPECIDPHVKKKNIDENDDDDDDAFWADMANATIETKDSHVSQVYRPPQQHHQHQQQIVDTPNTRVPPQKPPADPLHSVHPHPSSLSDASRNRSVPFEVNNKDRTTQSSNPYGAFKTAKEFAMDSKSDKVSSGSSGYPSQTPQQQQQHFDYRDSMDTDPWGSFKPSSNVNTKVSGNGGFNNATHTLNPSMDEPPSSNTFQRPALSAGLKRKFQLPKPRNQGGMGGGSTQNEKSFAGGGGATAVKPPTHRSNHAPPEEDDSLPEELKGLDKELISKIEMEIVDSGDPVSFQDIAGLAEAKQTVMELVCWPMKRPDLFTGLRRGPNGLLLFGPPGTGKTLIGKAIAHESGATFFSISSSSLTSKWIGEGEKLVRTLFAVAGYREPSVVFIDEIDSLLTQRKADENEASRRIKTEFLVQLDGTGTSGRGRVLVVGATNRPQELDDAARRRFVKRLYIPLPEAEDRALLLSTLLSKNHHNLNETDIQTLSLDTDGFSGADLKALCTDAALGPIRQLGARALDIDAKDIPPISYHHFRVALRGMNPSVAPSDLKAYLEWNDTYGSKKIMIEN